MKKRLLWVGDSSDCPSGFGKATREILAILCQTFDVTVLGMNYRGDPHEYPYKIYACEPGGDSFGLGRLIWMCDLMKPDVIVLQNDVWNMPMYFRKLAQFEEYADVPIVGIVAVDGKNCMGKTLNPLSLAIFWTQFGLDEAREGGYTGAATVIPLGVDLEIYRPMDKLDARWKRMPKEMDDKFIVGNVNRNQPRKRWDLTVRYFAEWIKQFKVEDAYLCLHVAPTGDIGVDIHNLACYYGIADRVLLVEPPVFYGLSEQEMAETYNCFDVDISTTLGEGFGLTTLEAMACGVPIIAPNWSALGEWTKDAAWLVPCTSTLVNAPIGAAHVIGGVVDEQLFITALQYLYANRDVLARNGQAALERAREPCFRWADIGAAYARAFAGVFEAKTEEAWQDLGRPELQSA